MTAEEFNARDFEPQQKVEITYSSNGKSITIICILYDAKIHPETPKKEEYPTGKIISLAIPERIVVIVGGEKTIYIKDITSITKYLEE